jgi:glutamyl-tRNA reductase
MSTYLSVSVSHHVADLERLEQVAVKAAGVRGLQQRLLELGFAEVMVVSTCSRTELHVVLDPPAGETDVEDAAGRLVGLLAGGAGDRPGEGANDGRGDLAKFAKVEAGDAAVHQLFRVAAGLDSRVVGEVEIRVQLRAAARAAVAAKGEPHRLRGLVAAALASAGTAAGTASGRRGLLAARAVACALDAVADPTAIDVVVVGAGTMGRQIVDALPTGTLATLLSRTSNSRPGAGPRVDPLEILPTRLHRADVVFVATSAGRRIMTADLVSEAMRARDGRRMVIFDLSVPRNVDPGVMATPGVTLLDLDDLGRGVAGRQVPGGQLSDGLDLAAAEAATGVAAERYVAGIRSRVAGPLIVALRSKVEQRCLERLRRQAEPGMPEDTLRRMASAAAGAVAHRPTVFLREAAAGGDEASMRLVARVFGLDGDGLAGLDT